MRRRTNDPDVKISTKDLRLLLARTQLQQEKSNIRLAREIHDDASQRLTALSIKLSLLQKRLGKHRESRKVGELLELVGHISATVRKAMNELRPKVLDEFGLIAAVKYECQREGKRHQRDIVFSSLIEDLDLPAASASEVFRLFQETLAHTLEAHPASVICVTAREGERQFQLDVIGNGSVAPVKNEEYRLRLLHIRENASRLGGSSAMIRHGVRLTIPLQGRKN